MGEVIQLQGDQRKDVQEFLVDKKEGLELDAKTIKVCFLCDHIHLPLWSDELRRFMASKSSAAPLDHLDQTGRILLRQAFCLAGCCCSTSVTQLNYGVERGVG